MSRIDLRCGPIPAFANDAHGIDHGAIRYIIAPPPIEYHPRNPFAASPANSKAIQDLKQSRSPMGRHWEGPVCAEQVRAEKGYWVKEYCSPCQEERAFDAIAPGEDEKLASGDSIALLAKFTTGNWAGIFRRLLIVGFSLFSEILSIRPRSADKCDKLLLNRLRDFQDLITTSYINDPAKLADAYSKHG